jgi:hypothetical protein
VPVDWILQGQREMEAAKDDIRWTGDSILAKDHDDVTPAEKLLLDAIDVVRDRRPKYGGPRHHFRRTIGMINAAFAAIHPTGPQQLPARLVLLIATTAGLLVQHGLHRTKDETMHAPLAYLAGLALAILPLKVALFALPIGILSGIGLRHLSWGFIMTAIAVGSFGFLFRQSLLTLATACFLLMLPIVLSRLVHRTLVVAVRSRLIRIKPAGYGPIR